MNIIELENLLSLNTKNIINGNSTIESWNSIKSSMEQLFPPDALDDFANKMTSNVVDSKRTSWSDWVSIQHFEKLGYNTKNKSLDFNSYVLDELESIYDKKFYDFINQFKFPSIKTLKEDLIEQLSKLGVYDSSLLETMLLSYQTQFNSPLTPQVLLQVIASHYYVNEEGLYPILDETLNTPSFSFRASVASRIPSINLIDEFIANEAFSQQEIIDFLDRKIQSKENENDWYFMPQNYFVTEKPILPNVNSSDWWEHMSEWGIGGFDDSWKSTAINFFSYVDRDAVSAKFYDMVQTLKQIEEPSNFAKEYSNIINHVKDFQDKVNNGVIYDNDKIIEDGKEWTNNQFKDFESWIHMFPEIHSVDRMYKIQHHSTKSNTKNN